ncbi:Fic family protein (plasmid) [Methylomarinum sp. Ch1-1]|uniref:Fic family protein n=1 Tax=Methylomarinum roseum TaxID=3067653 RepID=A0AAU7NP88_9GAMM|nr:Fic family protein [Methylomarinum sp. Ch1-1]MDP4523084.1 Fic family protein [Methylomarinum sp. Ch1-1]
MGENKLGYSWLKEHFNLEFIQVEPECYSEKISSIKQENTQSRLYPESYRSKDTTVDHFTFAMKYEALNLQCLAAVFQQSGVDEEIECALALNPGGKYTRLMGFYYELLTGKSLSVKKLNTGNYVDAVDQEHYYVSPSIKDRRFRINNNLTGTGKLSMLIRRNNNILSDGELKQLLIASVAEYPVEFLYRATRYLISKETKSSNEIESENISPNKMIRFVSALETINNESLTKEKLIKTLNIIKDKHYREFDYRYEQNYLSDASFNYTSVIDYVTPKPADAHELMDEWFVARDRVMQSDMPSIAKAAALSSCFVFIHPFMDGNGRMSRYIMQDTLYRTGVIDKQYSLPLSSGILLELKKYYDVLNEKSKNIMKHVDFHLDHHGRLTVEGDTSDLYRHLCFDSDAFFLSEIAKKVTQELIPEELEKLKLFDTICQDLKENIDLPNKDIGLIATLLINNQGRISIKKRKGVLMHVATESLNYAEKVFKDCIDDSDDGRLS